MTLSRFRFLQLLTTPLRHEDEDSDSVSSSPPHLSPAMTMKSPSNHHPTCPASFSVCLSCVKKGIHRGEKVKQVMPHPVFQMMVIIWGPIGPTMMLLPMLQMMVMPPWAHGGIALQKETSSRIERRNIWYPPLYRQLWPERLEASKIRTAPFKVCSKIYEKQL